MVVATVGMKMEDAQSAKINGAARAGFWRLSIWPIDVDVSSRAERPALFEQSSSRSLFIFTPHYNSQLLIVHKK